MDTGFVGLHDGRAARHLARAGMRVPGFDAARHGAALAPRAVAGDTVNAAMEHGVDAPV